MLISDIFCIFDKNEIEEMKEKVLVTETRLVKLISDAVWQVLSEGISVNRVGEDNIVTFDNSDKGIQDGPIKGQLILPNSQMPITTYSMFKRVNNLNGVRDGNPLLHALKEKPHWLLDNPEDFWKRFGELLSLFLKDHQNERIIMIPSNHSVNNKFKERIEQLAPNTMIFTGVLTKLTVDEIIDMIEDSNSYFRQYWIKQGANLNEIYEKTYYYLNRMKEKNGGVFSYSMIPDMSIRKSIVNSLKIGDAGDIYHSEFNGKDVLLLDDSISVGQTAESAINALKTCYQPHSISLITIFSELYKTK